MSGTIDALDVSSYSGSPIVLYDFFRRSTPTISGTLVETHWKYTSADRDIGPYKAVPISDDGVRQSGDTSTDQLTILMPYDETVPNMFVGSPPSDPIYCSIYHGNDGLSETYLVWTGIVGMVSRSSDSDGGDDAGNTTAAVVCNTIGATMDRTGLRLAWSRQCPHDLYGFMCKADPSLNFFTGPVTALTGTTVSAGVLSIGVGIMEGGFLEWLDEYGHAERAGIIGHVDGTVTILGLTDRLSIGTTIWAFFGCDHSRTTCHTRFDNLPNHGGHAYMPDENPFNGDSVF